MSERKDIRKFDLVEMTAAIAEMGEPKFRAKQVYEWLWKKSAISFDEMTNLSKELRIKLQQDFLIAPVQETIVQKSKDGTVKLGM